MRALELSTRTLERRCSWGGWVEEAALNLTEGEAALACRRANFVNTLEWVEPTVGNTSFIGFSMPFAYF